MPTAGLLRHTRDVDQTFRATVPAELAAVQATLRDLNSYQHWLNLVDEVGGAERLIDDPGEAFFVTLIARIGPFARRKRLRMVCTEMTEEGATFERREVDEREHSSWVLGARASGGQPTKVAMRLAYGGTLWTDALRSVLESQINGAVDGLAEYATHHHGQTTTDHPDAP